MTEAQGWLILGTLTLILATEINALGGFYSSMALSVIALIHMGVAVASRE